MQLATLPDDGHARATSTSASRCPGDSCRSRPTEKPPIKDLHPCRSRHRFSSRAPRGEPVGGGGEIVDILLSRDLPVLVLTDSTTTEPRHS